MSRKITIAFLVGTRPELIKMAPIILECKTRGFAKVLVVNTAQHRELIDPLFQIFGIKPDVQLDSMKKNQSLAMLTARLSEQLDQLFNEHPIDLVLGAGDTTTVFMGSLVAFYHRIPFAHVEAGLRTYKHYEPFPEEINRVLTAPLSKWHFCPTEAERKNLLKESIPDAQILVSGNPVIDSLFWILKQQSTPSPYASYTQLITVTAHRRENIGANHEKLCEAMVLLTQRFPELHFVLPLHPNPQVQSHLENLLQGKERIELCPPLDYPEFVSLMNASYLLLSDSGGVQEEAPALGKPVLVLRNTTERPAIIEQNMGWLIGNETQDIVEAVSHLLEDRELYQSMCPGYSPYGDGLAAKRIVDFLEGQYVPTKLQNA